MISRPAPNPPDWVKWFPELPGSGIGPGTHELAEILARAEIAGIPPETIIFRPGDRCERFFFVVSGTVRVHMLGETGREIILYRVEPGETCVLTTSCLISGQTYPTEGVAETPVTAAILSRADFDRALEFEPFRRFVLGAVGARLHTILAVLGEVAFRRMDARLAGWLAQTASADPRIERTHEELASELGTAREVVSRLLKEFERQGFVRLGRGEIVVTDITGLSRLSRV